ncbi:transposon Tf2-8 polyprotein [Trichonephila clavipes]|nr:transposon Tf2-8 polyprotein [Trichonephila clavipes]
MFTCLTSPVALLDIEVYEATGTVCADTGASQSVGGELMFKFLRNRGQKFSEFHLALCLADGQQSTSLVQKATVPITVGGRTFQIDLIFLPHAKGNCTLLGVDFLRTSGIAMDMRNNFWYFGDKPSFRIPFSKDVPLPVDDSSVEINSSSCPTNSIPSEIPLHGNTVDKTAAIQNIPSPRNLKQLQLFLQTCSWYRKFIPNFSDIARPLSNLSKKSTAWKWSEIEQQAFQTLKQCLITPPILRQVDPKKPFIIRTDASSYALGAVLLQGESPTDEQPVEYVSRLLSSAKKITRQQSEKPWL